jgi:hypothetical protein
VVGPALHFERLLRSFPAVLVYGPRRCGKSTLVREVCRGYLSPRPFAPVASLSYDRGIPVSELGGEITYEGFQVFANVPLLNGGGVLAGQWAALAANP